MSPTLNRSSLIRRFEGSNAIKIRNGITFDFYTELPHIQVAYINGWCIGSFTTWWFSYKLEFCKSESLSHRHQISECMIIVHLTHTNLQSVGKPCSCMQFITAILFVNSHKNLYQYTSQVRIRMRYYRSRVLEIFLMALEVISEHLILWGSMPPDSQVHACLHTHSSLTPPTLKYLPLPLCTDDVYSNMCGCVLLCCYGAITEMFFISRMAQHHCGLPARMDIFQY